MVSSWWPLADLWLQTPDLELRWPSLDDLHALADLAAAGVHDPEVQPFTVAWTDVPPEERARGTLQYHWSRWGSWTPSDWMLELAVIRGGTVVGTQGIGAHDFPVLREVHTGSWLGRVSPGSPKRPAHRTQPERIPHGPTSRQWRIVSLPPSARQAKPGTRHPRPRAALPN